MDRFETFVRALALTAIPLGAQVVIGSPWGILSALGLGLIAALLAGHWLTPMERQQRDQINALNAQVQRLAPLADPRKRREQEERYDSYYRVQR